MKRLYHILLLSNVIICLSACKKGYVTPTHAPAVVAANVTSVTFLGPISVDALYINGLPLNFGLDYAGNYGVTANRAYPLSVVNGQTFNFKLNAGNATVIDTTITVAEKGTDGYLVYNDKVNPARYHVYIFHTEAQTSPKKGMAKIRFVNALPGLAGDGSVSINLSRKQNLSVNNGKPLSFRSATVYQEIPYGTYQPLLLDADGAPVLKSVVDLSSQYGSSIYQWLPIQLKPGGVYTFLISKDYDYGSTSVHAGYLVPVKLIEEKVFPQQPMGNIKFVNVNPYLDEANIKVDGTSAYPASLTYGSDLNALSFDQGTHTLQVFDPAGKKVIDKEFTVFDQDRQLAFLVQGKNGVPDVVYYTLTDINNIYTGFNISATAFFNFSPDSPPASFLTAQTIRNTITYSLFTGDSLAVNVPYLRMPKLTGGNINPIYGAGGPYLVVSLPNLGIGYNIVNSPVSPADVVPEATMQTPFLEFPAFSVYYQNDTGYFIAMLTGLRYNAPAGKELRVRVIKYIL